ncbi:hypothetical protein BpHYR1_023765 [Brachionus plicatilis]|uniref:Uncharacterized protein n=1 Tax=Brachionus plicatilis TaxID=10195 RepID=A0A3M7SMJ8_BRAPC|nr:hypothetical protein BpHYR1_023765 [Brachionus plicatilis]
MTDAEIDRTKCVNIEYKNFALKLLINIYIILIYQTGFFVNNSLKNHSSSDINQFIIINNYAILKYNFLIYFYILKLEKTLIKNKHIGQLTRKTPKKN